MSEFDEDERVAGLLIGAADEAAMFIRPRGVDAVVRTVRRRRTRTPVVAALALVVIAVPPTVLGVTARHAPQTPTGDHPSTSASPTPSQSVTPSASVAPLPSSSRTGPAAPDGRIPADQLRNATLRIPAWPHGFDDSCPTGAVTFTGGKTGQGIEALRGDPVYLDVDHDGAQETIVLVSCSPQGDDYQVIALDRDTSGKVVTLGRVVGSAGNTGTEGSDIMTIWAIEAGDNGHVRVDVGEYRPCCQTAQASQHQWRTYAWNGQRFTQTSGPTTFGPNPNVTDLAITTDPLTMTKQADGSWTGTLRVTIHNNATFPTPGKLLLSLHIDETWHTRTSTTCGSLPVQPQASCVLPSLNPGANRTLTIQLTAPPGPLNTRCTASIGAIDANGAEYPDHKPGGLPTTIQIIQH